jgi:hypothetical protein
MLKLYPCFSNFSLFNIHLSLREREREEEEEEETEFGKFGGLCVRGGVGEGGGLVMLCDERSRTVLEHHSHSVQFNTLEAARA